MNKYSTCAVAYLVTGVCVICALYLTKNYLCLLALALPLAVLEIGDSGNK